MLPRIDDGLRVEGFTDALLVKLDEALPPPARSEPSGHRLRLAIAGTAVAALAACAALAWLGGRTPGGGGVPIASAPVPTTAAGVLRFTATAAEREAPLRAGQYLRVRMERWTSGGDGALHRVLFASWMAMDGSARFLIEPGRGSGFEHSAERCTPRGCLLRVAGQPPQALGVARYGPGRGFTAGQLQRLPTDPSRLMVAIQARARTGTGLSRDPWELGFPLLEAPLSPDVRAALYRALAQLPAVRRLGAESVGGQAGVALARRVRIGGATVERVIVVDPKTGALLAARATVDGRLMDRRTYTVTVVGSDSDNRVTG